MRRGLFVLFVFIMATLSSAFTPQLMSNVGRMSVGTFLNLPIQAVGSSQKSPSSGDMALTSGFILCVYNGSGWVMTSDGHTTCTF
jgi:hypothetical protein